MSLDPLSSEALDVERREDQSNMVLAIDPGTEKSGYVVMYHDRVHEKGWLSNAEMLERLRYYSQFTYPPLLAIEMVASYGMPVGREVFETVLWIGRFVQVWHAPDAVRLIYRRDIKSHLCNSAKAKDANIRQALIDKFGGDRAIGNKKNPGPLHGVTSHAWAALAVAVTAREVRKGL